jgi:peptidoglycan/LPS O-acetylase OafA/YrhL
MLDSLGSAQPTQAAWLLFMVYLQNWAYIPVPKLSFLLSATWSLAIEEQFYILWPSIVYFLDRRKLFFVSGGILLFSLAARLILMRFASHWLLLERFLYFGSFTHLDGLCVGALIANAFQSDALKQKLARFALPILGIALAAMTVIVLINPDVAPTGTNAYLITWGYTLLALISGALIVLLTTLSESNILRRIFRNRILIFFGKYSYSMYLIHLPIASVLWFKFMDIGRNSGLAWLTYVALSFGLTILGSLLTWHLLEKRALGLKKYFEYDAAEG